MKCFKRKKSVTLSQILQRQLCLCMLHDCSNISIQIVPAWLSKLLPIHFKATTDTSCHFCRVGACCPSGVRLYSMAANSLRVYWRSTDSSQSYIADMVGNRNNYTCTASPEKNHCDVGSVQCGDLYHVVVAPLTPGGSKVLLCPQRLYSGRTAP